MSTLGNTEVSIYEDAREEITVTPQDISSTQSSQQKTDNNSLPLKTAEDEICFAHEFANVESVTCSRAANVSSLSSSDVCVSSPGLDISNVANTSYMNPNISGLDELILKCGNICLQNEQTSQELSHNQTFASATEETFFHGNYYNCKNLQEIINNSIAQSENSAVSNDTQSFSSNEDIIAAGNKIQIIEENNSSENINTEEEQVMGSVSSVNAIKEKNVSNGDLESTLTLQEINIHLASTLEEEQYSQFKPQRQSTTLSLTQEEESDSKELTAQEVTNDLLNSSSDQTNEFVSATSEIFQDPSSFDFLLAQCNSGHTNRLRAESLYVKFDPLVSNTSISPHQTKSPSINEKQTDDENKTPLPDVRMPKHNVAIAAIERLLFYSSFSDGTLRKSEESQEKSDPGENSKSVINTNMINELKLVRGIVLQLEEESEKRKREHEAELEKQKTLLEEKMNKLQTEITQEMKANTQMTIVMEEYEKSISRLSTEQEKDRINFNQEITELQEKLQAAHNHLSNTEAAFNDVHQKYERLKGVVAMYKHNESVLKESIKENMDTIKALETRYDLLQNHATTQLENANLELDGIRKQNEAETVKLQAMIRKTELKSNSLAELVEQKTKENKELTKILDELITRVSHKPE